MTVILYDTLVRYTLDNTLPAELSYWEVSLLAGQQSHVLFYPMLVVRGRSNKVITHHLSTRKPEYHTMHPF